MANDTVIKVENLKKKFALDIRRSLTYGSIDMLRNFFGFPSDSSKLRKSEFWALDDVNFEIKQGEAVGLIGKNGSGKSTLLRLLTGIFPPDQGNITMHGAVGSLIAVGAGFHPHMTGRENIFLNGTILGMSNKELKSKFDQIVEFAEVGAFLDAPVSTYSSGMRVRLGFSIAIHSNPDILLVDEILSVGDLSFQQKCMAKMGKLIDNGVTIVLVSHNMNSIERVCDRAILLDKGKVVADGDTTNTLGKYYELNDNAEEYVFKEEGPKDNKLVSSYGITYDYLKFFDSNGNETRNFKTGDDIQIEWKFNIPEQLSLENVNLHFTLSDGPDTWNSYSTMFDEVKIEKLTSDTVIKLKLNNVLLSHGSYSIALGIWDENFIGSYFWDYLSTGKLNFSSEIPFQGRFAFQHSWEIVHG